MHGTVQACRRSGAGNDRRTHHANVVDPVSGKGWPFRLAPSNSRRSPRRITSALRRVSGLPNLRTGRKDSFQHISSHTELFNRDDRTVSVPPPPMRSMSRSASVSFPRSRPLFFLLTSLAEIVRQTQPHANGAKLLLFLLRGSIGSSRATHARSAGSDSLKCDDRH